MTIQRTSDGIIDHCLDKVEKIDAREDLDAERKAKIGLQYLREVRGFMSLNLQYKKLVIQSPDIAANRHIAMPAGTLIDNETGEEIPKKK